MAGMSRKARYWARKKLENQTRKQEKNLENEHYDEFNDEPIRSPYGGSKEYYGDGQSQYDWFLKNSNFNALIQGMSRIEREAFTDYWTVGHFMDGQQYRGFDNMSKFDQDLTRIYDKILDKATLSRGITVRRLTSAELLTGNKHATLDELRALEGTNVKSRGNMSCGVGAKGLHIGDLSKDIELNIHIPGGSKGKGAGMWIGDRRVNTEWNRKQREFITNRDTYWQVGKTRYDSSRKVYVVDLYYSGQDRHDYGKSKK